jgi:hypothetical protein
MLDVLAIVVHPDQRNCVGLEFPSDACRIMPVSVRTVGNEPIRVDSQFENT